MTDYVVGQPSWWPMSRTSKAGQPQGSTSTDAAPPSQYGWCSSSSSAPQVQGETRCAIRQVSHGRQTSGANGHG